MLQPKLFSNKSKFYLATVSRQDMPPNPLQRHFFGLNKENQTLLRHLTQNLFKIQICLSTLTTVALFEKIFASKTSRKINLHHSRQEIIHLLAGICKKTCEKIQPYEETAAQTGRFQLNLETAGLNIKELPKDLKLLECFPDSPYKHKENCSKKQY